MIDNDDLLYRVDRHYLGPTGLTFPVRIRYAALGLGFALFLTLFIIGRAIVHVPLSFMSFAIMIAITYVITAKVTKYVNADRPPSIGLPSRVERPHCSAPAPPRSDRRGAHSCRSARPS